MLSAHSRLLFPTAALSSFFTCKHSFCAHFITQPVLSLRSFKQHSLNQNLYTKQHTGRRRSILRLCTCSLVQSRPMSLTTVHTPQALPQIQLVVAAARLQNDDSKLGIGAKGDLPWKLDAEMKYFKDLTSTSSKPGCKNAVIMGRKTWESLPQKFRPLPNRVNVVLTRSGALPGLNDTAENISPNRPVTQGKSASEDVVVAPSLDNALQQLAGMPNIGHVFVIGGGAVYEEALRSEQCTAVYITMINGFENEQFDTFFPALDSAQQNSSTQNGASGKKWRLWSASPVRRETDKRHASEVTYSFMVYVDINASQAPALPAAVASRHEEYQYLDMVRDVISRGALRGDRTGTGTYSLFGTTMRFNLRHSFPVLTTKRVFWRGVVEELLWFVQGCTSAKVLQDKGVHIWDGNGSREYLDSIGLTDREEGDLGPVYGFQWRHFGAQYKDMHTDYTGQGVDQLADLVHRIKTNPNDRRLVLTAWNPAALKEMALPPCHMFCQFYVANGELSCQMYQRSCDLGLGVPFNIASYSLLTCMMAQVCGLKPGEFVHVLGDAHVYCNHVEPLQEQLKNAPRAFPTLRINPDVKDIDGFKFEDFTLEDYKPHKTISMKMAV